jgi:hypothetical protein
MIGTQQARKCLGVVNRKISYSRAFGRRFINSKLDNRPGLFEDNLMFDKLIWVEIAPRQLE